MYLKNRECANGFRPETIKELSGVYKLQGQVGSLRRG